MGKYKASNEENDIRETREYHRVTEDVSLSVFLGKENFVYGSF